MREDKHICKVNILEKLNRRDRAIVNFRRSARLVDSLSKKTTRCYACQRKHSNVRQLCKITNAY